MSVNVQQCLQETINNGFGGSRKAFAQWAGLSPSYVGDVLRGNREPGQKILDALGLKRVVEYEVK
jgi:hypothetical protein